MYVLSENRRAFLAFLLCMMSDSNSMGSIKGAVCRFGQGTHNCNIYTIDKVIIRHSYFFIAE